MGGDGGAGYWYATKDTSYAGGGGGGTNSNQVDNKYGKGGTGGGGDAGANDKAPQNGTNGLGGGGGGGAWSTHTTGGNGGSGIVIVIYISKTGELTTWHSTNVTDANGQYSFDDLEVVSEAYTAICSYEGSTGDQYHALAYPFLTPYDDLYGTSKTETSGLGTLST